MPVIRVNHPDPYTHIHNAMLRDARLCAKTKGVLAMMLSCPPDWDFSVRGLQAMTGEGRHSLKGCMDELKAAGYLRVTKLAPGQGSANRYEYVYDVYGLSQESIVENSEAEKPQMGQEAENRPLTPGESDRLSGEASSAGFEALEEPALNKLMNDKGQREDDFENERENPSPPSASPTVKAPDGLDAMLDGMLKVAVNRNRSDWVMAKARRHLRALIARGFPYPALLAALAAYQEALKASGRMPEFFPNLAKMLDPASPGGIAYFLPKKMPSNRVLGTYLAKEPGCYQLRSAFDKAKDTGTADERAKAEAALDAFVDARKALAFERYMKDKTRRPERR